MAGRRGFGRIDKLPSGNWRARYAGPDTKLHKAPHTFTMRGHAERWLDDEERLISMGDWTPPADRAQVSASRGITLSTYAEKVLERRSTRSRNPLRPLTRQDYEKLLDLHILPAIGEVPLRRITAARVRDWYDECSPGKATTRGKSYDLLHSIMADALRDGLIAANPCQIVGGGKPKRHKAVDALPADVLVQYLEAVDQHYRLPLMIAATCGLRSGEVRGLRRRDVDLKAGVLHIRRQVIEPEDGVTVFAFTEPKSAAGVRDVAMPARLVELLAEWLEGLPAKGRDALVFPARDHRAPMPSSTLYKNHKRAAVKIGRPGLTVHDLRRTAASMAAEDGATLAELKALLGHTTADVALLYQVPDRRRDGDRAKRLDAKLGKALGEI